MRKFLMIIGTVYGAIGVIIGAFAAHLYHDELVNIGRLETFQTALEFHFIHTLAAIIAPLLVKKSIHTSKAKTASFLFLMGVTLFSGSLYFLCFAHSKLLIFVTPVGGLSLILGWLVLSYAIYRTEFNDSIKIKES